MDTNSQKISLFVSQTGTTQKVAQEILRENGWSVEQAVKIYRYMSEAAAMPRGPQKNTDMKQMNRQTSEKNFGILSSVTLPTSCFKVASDAVNKTDQMNGSQCNNSPSSTLNCRIKRGISKTTDDSQIMNIARDVLHGIQEGQETRLQWFVETPEYTFILPDINHYSEDFKTFLNKDLIEMSTLVSLEQAGRLNWWVDVGACQRLLPLATTGDGNCLLHAASLALWGFHDRLLTLRKTLCQTMMNSHAKEAFFRRWRWHQTQINKQSGLIFSEQEWLEEWNNLAKLASAQPRTHPGCLPVAGRHSPATNSKCSSEERESDEEIEILYESLEELHVFVLAHVLRRPIIIVADTILKDSNGEALAPISFGGIYMPLECDPSDCHRSPLLLTYDAAHFSALVPMEEMTSSQMHGTVKLAAAIPLVDPNFQLLPLHFFVDPGSNYQWSKENDESEDDSSENFNPTLADRLLLLQKYMDVDQLNIPFTDVVVNGTACGANDGLVNGNSQIKSNSASTTSTEPLENGLGNGSGIETLASNGKRKLSIITKNQDDDSIPVNNKTKERSKFRSLAKSVSSLKKSLRRTFSRNFCASAKSGKRSEVPDRIKEVTESDGERTELMCESNNAVPLTVIELNGRNKLLCARLLHKRLEYQEEIVRNYLTSAAERFQQEKEMLRQQDAELKHLTERRRQEQEIVQCVNAGCKGKATAATCYLCLECFERQKQEELDMKIIQAGSPTSGATVLKLDRVDSGPSLPSHVPATGIPQRQLIGRPNDSIATKGKGQGPSSNRSSINRSKSQEEALRMSSVNGVNRNVSMNNSRQTVNASAHLAREVPHSAFYDGADSPFRGQVTRSSTMTSSMVINDLHQKPENGDELPLAADNFKKSSNPVGPNINLNCGWEDCDESSVKKSVIKSNDRELVNSPWVSRDDLTMLPLLQKKCVTIGCEFHGTEATEYLCSACFRERSVNCSNSIFLTNKVAR